MTPHSRIEALEGALAPFAKLAGPINGEIGRPTYLEAISGPNGTDELELRTLVGDGTRMEILNASDFRRAAAALTDQIAKGSEPLAEDFACIASRPLSGADWNQPEPLAEGELLPCPFCGGAGDTCEDEGQWCAICTSGHCFAAVGEGYDASAMPDHCFDTEAVAIAAWNRRATSSVPPGHSEREIVERCAKIAEQVGNFGNYRRDELTDDYGMPRFDLMRDIAKAIRASSPDREGRDG